MLSRSLFLRQATTFILLIPCKGNLTLIGARAPLSKLLDRETENIRDHFRHKVSAAASKSSIRKSFKLLYHPDTKAADI